MKRLYLAGSYSAPSVIQALENIRKGLRAGTEALLAGWAVFAPWADHQLFLQLREGEEIPLAVIQEHSLAWLEVSEAMLVLPGWENSLGTRREIARARELEIPVFFSLEDLRKSEVSATL